MLECKISFPFLSLVRRLLTGPFEWQSRPIPCFHIYLHMYGE